MRNERTWRETVMPSVIQKLSPRIQRDLKIIPIPTKLPQMCNMYIHGEVGTGKTIDAIMMLLGAAMERYLQNRQGEILYMSVPELITEIQDSFGNHETTRHEILERFSEAYFLILDDLGAEKPTEFVMTMLYLIINRRYENMLPTVITSNFDLDTLASRLGDDRVTSRIEREYIIKHKTGKWRRI